MLLRWKDSPFLFHDQQISTLDKLPVEILLHIASFLPTSSIACLSLTSKWYHQVLSDQFDPKWRNNRTEKRRFLQLLEDDLPEQMLCSICNTLYRRHPRIASFCLSYLSHTSARSTVSRCSSHLLFINRNMVDEFVRGFVKGPRYGPQLDELSHKCILGDATFPYDEKRGIFMSRSLDARVVKGKLLLHSVHKTSVILSTELHETRVLTESPKGVIPKGLLPSIDRFRYIGCAHTPQTLPAVLLDAYQARSDSYCHHLLSCGHCATDLRVRVGVQRQDKRECIQIEVEIWRSLGGRDLDKREASEDAHFSLGTQNADFNINDPPERDLEDLFNGVAEKECAQKSKTWIQSWYWDYNPYTMRLWQYHAPRDYDRSRQPGWPRPRHITCLPS